VALSLAYPAFAADPTTRPASVNDEIKLLRARIDELEARQKQDEQLRQESAQKLEEKVTAAALNKNALEHDQFITAEGFTAGYSNKRFIIQSGDGNFLAHPWLHLQFRDATVLRTDFQGIKSKPEDEVDTGFEVRQVRFGVDGNLFSPDLTYFFNWATQRTSSAAIVSGATPSTTGGKVTVSNNLGGVPVLQQAWVKYRIPATDFFIKAGEIKDPLLHEQIVDTRFQQSAERSLSADIFANGDDFTEAVTVIYDPGKEWRVEAGVNHGMRSANTNFFSFPDNGSFNQFDFGLAGRADYKVMGNWRDYTQMGGVGVKDPLLVVGAGVDYSERGHAGQTVMVADLTYVEPSGLNVYASLIDRYTSHSFGFYTQSATGATITAGADTDKHTNEYSILLQAGYMVDEHLEPFFRYEYIRLRGTPAGSNNFVQAVTGGANYYFYDHRLKVTGQFTFLPNGLPFDDTSNDILANTNGKSEVTFIAQLQLIL
jgi:hypothetical protein